MAGKKRELRDHRQQDQEKICSTEATRKEGDERGSHHREEPPPGPPDKPTE